MDRHAKSATPRATPPGRGGQGRELPADPGLERNSAIDYYGRSGLLPPLHASPGLNALGLARPNFTSWPKDCETPPGPFGPLPSSGAVGSSFFPENTQIEFACAGPWVGLPLPVISPAKAGAANAPA